MKKNFLRNSFNIFVIYYIVFVNIYLYNRVFPSIFLKKFLLANAVIMFVLLFYSYIKYLKTAKSVSLANKERGGYYLLLFITLSALRFNLIDF